MGSELNKIEKEEFLRKMIHTCKNTKYCIDCPYDIKCNILYISSMSSPILHDATIPKTLSGEKKFRVF